MVIFNLYYGVMRAQVTGGHGTGFRDQGYKGYAMVHVPKSPKSMVQVGSVKEGANVQVAYYADQLGNTTVTNPKHINAFAGLGYPIYDGDGVTCNRDDMIWPDKIREVLTPGDFGPYERKILEALKERR